MVVMSENLVQKSAFLLLFDLNKLRFTDCSVKRKKNCLSSRQAIFTNLKINLIP